MHCERLYTSAAVLILRRQETRGRNTAVTRPVWAHSSFRSICDYYISMQLLFTFAFLAILLKSVKLHSGSLFAHLLIDIVSDIAIFVLKRDVKLQLTN